MKLNTVYILYNSNVIKNNKCLTLLLYTTVDTIFFVNKISMIPTCNHMTVKYSIKLSYRNWNSSLTKNFLFNNHLSLVRFFLSKKSKKYQKADLLCVIFSTFLWEINEKNSLIIVSLLRYIRALNS